MSTPASVLGVLAMCRVDSPTLHSCKPRGNWPAGGVCKVCKVYARARTHAHIFFTGLNHQQPPFNSYARTENPYTPYTPYTDALKALFLLGLQCVGFVLGMGFLCWVGVFGGGRGDE